jgi:hypothetical protein
MNNANGHKKVTLIWEMIDVDTAYEYLETMEGQNRPVKKTVVEKYTRDMKAGRWLKTTTPLKFDTGGKLFDGQHRLWALIEAGISFEFLVARGCNPDERHVQDIGAGRNVRDILSFEGDKVRMLAVAVANAMARSFQTTFTPTIQEQREYYLRNREPIEWVISYVPKLTRGLTQASMLAPVARAWYSEDREKLARWLEVWKEGMPADESEYVIILLRNFALEKAGQKRDGFENYGKAERALRAYLDGERLKTLKALSQEVFLIPGENGAKKLAPRKKVK